MLYCPLVQYHPSLGGAVMLPGNILLKGNRRVGISRRWNEGRDPQGQLPKCLLHRPKLEPQRSAKKRREALSSSRLTRGRKGLRAVHKLTYKELSSVGYPRIFWTLAENAVQMCKGGRQLEKQRAEDIQHERRWSLNY